MRVKIVLSDLMKFYVLTLERFTQTALDKLSVKL